MYSRSMSISGVTDDEEKEVIWSIAKIMNIIVYLTKKHTPDRTFLLINYPLSVLFSYNEQRDGKITEISVGGVVLGYELVTFFEDKGGRSATVQINCLKRALTYHKFSAFGKGSSV